MFYIFLFCRKLESEGFPEGVETQQQKEEYCNELNEAMEGLGLKPENVRLNWPRRQVSQNKFIKNIRYFSVEQIY